MAEPGQIEMAGATQIQLFGAERARDCLPTPSDLEADGQLIHPI